MASLKYASDIDLSRNKILNLTEIQGYTENENELATGLKITTAENTEGNLVLGTANPGTKGNVFILAGQDLNAAKEAAGNSESAGVEELGISASQLPGISLLNDTSISLKAAKKSSASKDTPKIRIWGQDGVYLAKGTDSSVFSSLNNIGNLPSSIKIEDNITQHSSNNIDITADKELKLGGSSSGGAKLTEYFKTASLTFTDEYSESIGLQSDGTYGYTLTATPKTTEDGKTVYPEVTETVQNLNTTKSLTAAGDSVTFGVNKFTLKSPGTNPVLSIIQNGTTSGIVSTTNTVSDALTVGKSVTLNEVNDSDAPFRITAKGTTYFDLTKNFDLKGSGIEEPDLETKSIIHSEVLDSNRTTTINSNNVNVSSLLKSTTGTTLAGTVDINNGNNSGTLTVKGGSTTINSTTVNIGEGNTTDLTVNVGTLSKTSAKEVEDISSSITRTLKYKASENGESTEFGESISPKGYSATSSTSYTLTAEKAFILNAGKESSSNNVSDYSLEIKTSEDDNYSSSSIKTSALNATTSLETPIASIGNYATVKNYVTIGDIQIKYDASSQSLIFGAV